jgi:gluconokinase
MAQSSIVTPTKVSPGCAVVMGVSGCGKSTLGSQLAQALGWQFIEGDAFHPPANIARMAAGVALTDADRADWLQILAEQIRAVQARGQGVVLSCSALKRAYREVLRQADPALALIFLEGAHGLLAQRVAERSHAYMPASLLESQLLTLEVPTSEEHALTLDIAQPVSSLVADSAGWLRVRLALDNPGPAPTRMTS